MSEVGETKHYRARSRRKEPRGSLLQAPKGWNGQVFATGRFERGALDGETFAGAWMTAWRLPAERLQVRRV